MKKQYSGYRHGNEAQAMKELKVRRERAEKNSNGKQTNSVFATSDGEFMDACKKAGVNPTARQASKFRNGYGKAAWIVGRNTRKVMGLTDGR